MIFKFYHLLSNSILDSAVLNFDAQAQWVLNIALALVMFGVSLEIAIEDFKRLYHRPKPIMAGVFSQFILLPAITFLLVWAIEPLPSIAMGMFMVAACPGGNVSNFITNLAKGNTALSVSITAFTTVFAVVMTPLNLTFWGGLYAPSAEILKEVSLSPSQMVKLVALLLGLPLVLGMYINHRRPQLALRLARVFKPLSLLFFVLLIFLALFNNRDIFINYILYIFWIVVLHNLMAFMTGYSFARVIGLSQRNVRSITIETGIQNSGLGLLLIFSFFDGLGGMALLTAFWGIWHLVSGLLLASFWGRKPIKGKRLI